MSITHYGSPGTSERSPTEMEDESDVESDVFTISTEDKRTMEVMNELLSFLHVHESNPIHARVQVAEVVKRVLRPSVPVFSVVVTHENGTEIGQVRRKFAELVVLQKRLKEKLPGCLVPPISKKGLGEESSTMKKQEIAFELFLNNALRHPFIRNEKLLLDFLRSKDTFNAQRVAYLNGDLSEGLENWSKMIILCSTPKKPMMLMGNLEKEINLMLGFYRTLKKDLHEYADKLEHEKAGLSGIATTFDNWVKMEGGNIPTLIGSASIKRRAGSVGSHESDDQRTLGSNVGAYENLSLSNVVNGIGATFAANSEEINAIIVGLTKIVKGDLNFEIKLLSNFKNELKTGRDAVSSYKRAYKTFKYYEKAYGEREEKVKKILEKQQLIDNQLTAAANLAADVGAKPDAPPQTPQQTREREPTSPGLRVNTDVGHQRHDFDVAVSPDDVNADRQVQKLRQNLEDARAAHEAALKYYHTVLRALLVIELNRFKYERAVRGTKIIKELSGLQFSYATMIFENWRKAFENVPPVMSITARSDLNLLENIKENIDFHHAVLREEKHEESAVRRGNAPSIVSESEAIQIEPSTETKEEPGETAVHATYRALYSFEREREDERDLKEGEILNGVLSKDNPGWFYVFGEGYVPLTYLEKYEGASQDGEHATKPTTLSTKSTSKLSITLASPNLEKPKVARVVTAAPPASRPTGLLSSIQGFNKDQLKKVPE